MGHWVSETRDLHACAGKGSENLWLGRVIKNLGLGLMVTGGQKQVLQLLNLRRLQLITQMVHGVLDA